MKIDNKPHLYVIFTSSGLEQDYMSLMYNTMVEKPEALGRDLENSSGTIVEPWEEYLFAPKVIMRRKIKGIWSGVPRYMLPGYVFFNTNAPYDFVRRWHDASPRQEFCASFRLLYHHGSVDWSVEDAKWPKGVSLMDYRAMLEKKYGFAMGRLSDDEEKYILSLCGLERAEDGGLVRYRKNDIEGVDEELIKKYELSTIANVYSSAKIDNNGSIDIGLSKAVKVMNGRDQYGRPINPRIIILSGPLKNFHGVLVHVNAHKRVATVSIPMMHNKITANVPLEIIKVIGDPNNPAYPAA